LIWNRTVECPGTSAGTVREFDVLWPCLVADRDEKSADAAQAESELRLLLEVLAGGNDRTVR
jgi:hypothetical protein